MKRSLADYGPAKPERYERFREAKRELYGLISKKEAQAIIQGLIEDDESWSLFAERFSKLS